MLPPIDVFYCICYPMTHHSRPLRCSFQSTANLDHETDLAVQKAIRDELGDADGHGGGSGATILCIAHRLHTIIDFDGVLVLSQGEVLEYDSPSALLRKDGRSPSSSSSTDGAKAEPASEFWKLCNESGDLEGLKEVAFAHEKQKQEAAGSKAGRGQ